EISDQLEQRLLILGDPGSGKTTTLLELARDLITRAKNDPRQPIPVVFHLSTWTKDQSFVMWLAREIGNKYRISSEMGREWLVKNRLLLLLDGLNEVTPEHRAACVQAINEFGGKTGCPGIAVCSRLEEYTAL